MPDYSQDIQRAANAIKNGDNDSARALLQDILMNDPNNPALEQGWLYYAQVAENKEETIYCLQKVLEFNPNNQRARLDLAKLQGITLPPPSPPGKPASPAPARPRSTPEPAPKPSSPRRAIPKIPGLSQQNTYMILGGALLALCMLCGIGIFISLDSLNAASSPDPSLGLPTSTTLPPTPLPPTPLYTERADCICQQVDDYLIRTGERYNRLLIDINDVQAKMQANQADQVDYMVLNVNAQAIYKEQVADVAPPCLQTFQSKSNLLFWNWQQAMEFASAQNYDVARNFLNSFTEQGLGLKAEAGIIRGILQACPEMKKEEAPVF
jgi:tetratricopeptide (TPR) repeat protein